MLHNTNDMNLSLAVTSSEVEMTSQVVDENSTCDTPEADIKIDRGVPSWLVTD